MRVRITREPPPSYRDSVDSLLVGRVYNLDAALASALLAEECAELYDTLTPDERKFRHDAQRGQMWEAHDRRRAPQWGVRSGLLQPDPTDA